MIRYSNPHHLAALVHPFVMRPGGIRHTVRRDPRTVRRTKHIPHAVAELAPIVPVSQRAGKPRETMSRQRIFPELLATKFQRFSQSQTRQQMPQPARQSTGQTHRTRQQSISMQGHSQVSDGISDEVAKEASFFKALNAQLHQSSHNNH
jgi:hypothetical protein